MNENNQDNILSSEKKMNLAPVSSDMVELSEQRATELAKPFEREEPAAETAETTTATTEEQPQTYADPLANFNPETVAEPVQQATPEVYPTPTKPTFSAPQMQEVQAVQVVEDKSIQLREKWSIALGFGAIPLGFTTVLLSVYLTVMALGAAFGGSLQSILGTAKIIEVIYWVIFIGIIAMPIIGFILGNKYEKATGKISVGKIMSIVSGIVVGVIVALSIFIFVQQQIKKAEYEKQLEQYNSSRSLYN